MNKSFTYLLLNTELGFFVLAFVACVILFLIGFVLKKKGEAIGNLVMLLSSMIFIVMELLIIT